jgi:putative CRISPR-associated protein (TIGR02620 family)
MSTFIVTRHAGAIRWLNSSGITGEIISQWTDERTNQLVPGDLVVGVLPLPLIADVIRTGARFGLLILPAIAFSQRGQELSPEEMEHAGANVTEILSVTMGGLLV